MEVAHGARNFFNVCVAMIVLDTISIIIRFWSRSVTTGVSFRADDWVALASWPFAVTTSALFIGMILQGMGQPTAEIEATHPEQLVQYLKFLYGAEITFDFAISLPKISALLFYLRIFGLKQNQYKFYRWGWWISFGFAIAWLLAFGILDFAQCIPARKYWYTDIPGHCTEGTLASTIPATISSVIIDLSILLLPVPVLISLNMRWQKKLASVFILFVGYGVVVGSIGRMVAAIVLVPETEQDPLLNGPKVFFWAGFEPGMSLIAINLPPLLQLAQRGWQWGLSSLFSTRNYEMHPLHDMPTHAGNGAATTRDFDNSASNMSLARSNDPPAGRSIVHESGKSTGGGTVPFVHGDNVNIDLENFDERRPGDV